MQMEDPGPGATWSLACAVTLDLSLPAPGLPLCYLPPLVLRLTLHEAYPGLAPPRLALEASWLAAPLAAKLAAALEALWHAELATQPAGYAWAEWLRVEVLDQMGAGSGALRLQVRDEDEAQTLLANLLRHDAGCRARAWLAVSHPCGICLEDLPGPAFSRLACGHAFCSPCLGAAAELAVREGALGALRCPQPGCGAALDPGALRALLPADLHARWEALTLDRALAAMPDAARCPRCTGVCLEDEDACARCARCLFVFCALCGEGWHPGSACVSAQTRLAMLRAKAEGGGAAAREALRRAEQEAATAALLARDTKPCPRCGVACQRDEGCNKMTCGACGAFFCYRCGRAISGYRHFGDGSCVLFDEAEILRWEEDWEARVAAHRAEQGGGDGVGQGPHDPGRGHGPRPRRARPGRPGIAPCPQCGQFIEKQGGNNHMLCWSCTSHFCYLCRRLLLRRGEGATHFGPSGCRQHSAD
ncbi:hypothetical protein ACKKBG_A37275 [Auxenochlorella protothecoides x Auxenochlorella symbiontica]